MASDERQLRDCESSRWDSDLRAVFLNCTLQRWPELSPIEGRIAISKEVTEKDAGCRFDFANLAHRWGRPSPMRSARGA